MYEYDYSGDMKFFQDQLAEKGITKEMLNMDNFAGQQARGTARTSRDSRSRVPEMAL